METTYKLNARELTPSFVASIQGVYLDRDIEITVRDAENSPDEAEMDATEYLMQSPANRTKISKAIENIERGENLISFENLEQAIQCAKERNRR
jgi:antitoxin YefM